MQQSVPELKDALVELNGKNIDELLLDLRGNTGGGFQFALNIGGMFMDNKEMVTALGRGDEKSIFKSSYPEGVLFNKPLVLLTDGLSASASEVLAGGLHDNCRAVLTGGTTFGKGKIQAVFGLAASKDAGHQIVGTGGLSCIACHQFNGQKSGKGWKEGSKEGSKEG